MVLVVKWLSVVVSGLFPLFVVALAVYVVAAGEVAGFYAVVGQFEILGDEPVAAQLLGFRDAAAQDALAQGGGV